MIPTIRERTVVANSCEPCRRPAGGFLSGGSHYHFLDMLFSMTFSRNMCALSRIVRNSKGTLLFSPCGWRRVPFYYTPFCVCYMLFQTAFRVVYLSLFHYKCAVQQCSRVVHEIPFPCRNIGIFSRLYGSDFIG